MNLHPEYIEFLQNEVKAFNNELISILGLPEVWRLRNRIKKDKRDTEDMLDLYSHITHCNVLIRVVKANMRGCNAEARRLLGHGLHRPKRKYVNYNSSYDLQEE